MRRKIEELSDPENVTSSHIKQVTPSVLVIGSIVKSEGEEMKPCVYVVCGDIADLNQELKKRVFEMPCFEQSDPKKKAVFRSLYVKERELLLLGHTKSEKIRALTFGFGRKIFEQITVNILLDGNITEIQKLDLIYTTFRGIVLVREEKPAPGQKKEEDTYIFHQKKRIKFAKPPSLFVLDSKGDMHVFPYFDTRYAAPTFSMLIRRLPVEEFTKRKRTLGNERGKIRSKSQHKKMGLVDFTSVPVKKRSKSEVKIMKSASKIKIT